MDLFTPNSLRNPFQLRKVLEVIRQEVTTERVQSLLRILLQWTQLPDKVYDVEECATFLLPVLFQYLEQLFSKIIILKKKTSETNQLSKENEIRSITQNEEDLIVGTLEVLVECASRSNLNNLVEEINGKETLKKISQLFKDHEKIQNLVNRFDQQLTNTALDKFVRRFTFTSDNLEPIVVKLRLEQNENVGVGWKVWEGSLISGRWIHQHSSLFKSQSVLEVGSGCGLSGLVVAHFAKETVLSDCLPSIIRNLEYSISLNPLIKTKTRAILLDWLIVESNHEMIPQTERYSFDVIIGSEVLYQPKSSLALATVVNHFLKREGVFYCVSMEERFRLGFKPFIDKLTELNFDIHIERVERQYFDDFADENQWVLLICQRCQSSNNSSDHQCQSE